MGLKWAIWDKWHLLIKKKPKINNAAIKLEKHMGYNLWTQTCANFRNFYTTFPLSSLSPAIWLLSSKHKYNENAMLMVDSFILRRKLSFLCFNCLWEYCRSNLKKNCHIIQITGMRSCLIGGSPCQSESRHQHLDFTF